jgi:hypothetical protein
MSAMPPQAFGLDCRPADAGRQEGECINVRMCVRACARMCVRACVCVCVCGGGGGWARRTSSGTCTCGEEMDGSSREDSQVSEDTPQQENNRSLRAAWMGTVNGNGAAGLKRVRRRCCAGSRC